MSARLRDLARQTERIVTAGRYEAPDGREVPLGPAIDAAQAGTRVYGPEPVPVPTAHDGADGYGLHPDPVQIALPRGGTWIEVTGESSLEAARRLAAGSAGPPAVLNFASARNPGGGYLNGAQAQEEALCRASALYTCLLRAPAFYEHHRTHRDPFYTDRVIHSPGVPVFRDDRDRLLAEPFTAGFLTSPAPNAGVIRRTAPERASDLPRALAVRAERVLETAAAHGYRALVLGAWGCGVFRNDPAQVAAAFRALLEPGGRFAGTFAHVVFGVLDRTRDQAVRTAFDRAFADLAAPGDAAPQLQP
ncbi:TIGR02452 family protein [Streptomyces sp. 15-116A]|uniref:TIGR02452 family protein n=1 Tax=Streptomyces sp. 15-116A TaxID=2259035 RepID=UPI0021B1E85D|nr:TIGR02452 family protein [Streptomyces sp. 15-116A]MCT7355386.1 TIGR02452 family protein [Streptomyces sp. 15-116A]